MLRKSKRINDLLELEASSPQPPTSHINPLDDLDEELLKMLPKVEDLMKEIAKAKAEAEAKAEDQAISEAMMIIQKSSIKFARSKAITFRQEVRSKHTNDPVTPNNPMVRMGKFDKLGFIK
jgi:chorismate mutase